MNTNELLYSLKKVQKKNIIIVFLAVLAAILVWWQFMRSSQPVSDSEANAEPVAETKVSKYLQTNNFPLTEREGFCISNSVTQPYRADAWRCDVNNEIKDPCFYVESEDTMVCDVNPYSPAVGFQLRLTKILPTARIVEPAKENWGWLVLLEDGTVCAPFTGEIPVIDGKTAAFGCVSAQGRENVVLLGDLKIDKVWTATKAVFTMEGGKPVIGSSYQVRIREIWQ